MTNRRELADRLERMASAQPMLLTMPPQETDGAKALREAARLLREPVAGEVERLRAGLEEVVCWFAEAPHTFPDWKTTAEALAHMAQNVLDGHPALSTPDSRARLDAEGKGGEA